MTGRRGRDALLDVLRSEGVRHVFGNPGSTELPLIDALATARELEYVLALQEASVVGMADGYAQATGRPAFVNLHTSAGLGNGIGALTNARTVGVPLVVTAGNADVRHLHYDPMLSGDLASIARPVSKTSHEVRSLGEVGTIMRRAFHDAMTWPRGPVFVSLPMSVLDEEGDAPAPGPSRIDLASTAGGLEELADLLRSTPVGKLGIVAGDAVGASGAVGALVAVAEALGAPVHAAPLHAVGVFPPAHPLFAGMLNPSAQAIRGVLAAYDRVLFVGSQPFLVYPYSDGSPLPAHVELLHLSPDAAQIGRTFPTRLGVHGDPAATLAALATRLGPPSDAARDALDAARPSRAAQIERLEESARNRYLTTPADPMAAAHALVRAIPANTPVVDEAITTGGYVRGFHHWTEPGNYFMCNGGGLGWGMPAALGVSLGRDRSPVLCVVGDGSAMYSPQALWTAARERLPVVFAVVNNRQYLILKNTLRGMNGESVSSGRIVGLDLQPAIDYVGLARSLGIDALLVEKPADVGAAVEAALASGRPQLIEIPIAAPA